MYFYRSPRYTHHEHKKKGGFPLGRIADTINRLDGLLGSEFNRPVAEVRFMR